MGFHYVLGFWFRNVRERVAHTNQGAHSSAYYAYIDIYNFRS